MKAKFPALNLKTKLVGFIVVLLALTLGAEALVSLETQNAIVAATQEDVKDLAGAIQISVRELTAVRSTDRDRLASFVRDLSHRGIEVSIASSEDLIVNSSDPRLIGSELNPRARELLAGEKIKKDDKPLRVPYYRLDPLMPEATVYLIPVVVEDHLMGYVQVVARFGDYTHLLRVNRRRLITLAALIFAIGIVFSYVLAERYVRPIHEVAAAAQNITARGLEPVPDVRRRDEIGLLIRSFNQMVSELVRARTREQELNRLERFTALGQLAGGLAHEIKNPLNFINLAVDQFRARYGPQISQDRDTFIRQIGAIKEEIKRLSALTQNFLNYGKPVEINPRPSDLRTLVHEVLALSESQLKSQGIEVSEGGDGTPMLLNIDKEKIRNCFINVVANAVQAMPDGGRLEINFRREPTQVVVTFSDNGIGIDPETAARVFEPFFTTKREGIGIGLFLSKAIMERHGGSIAVGLNPAGRGTTVTFAFPLDAA